MNPKLRSLSLNLKNVILCPLQEAILQFSSFIISKTFLLSVCFTIKILEFFMSFQNYTNITISKTLKMLEFIKRIFRKFTSPSCLRFLYPALIRSTPEYNVIISHLYLVKDPLKIKRIKNKFLSYVTYILKIEHTSIWLLLFHQSVNI